MGSAELIARAYRRWGLQFPARLSGPFFVVVVDVERSRVLLVSDVLNQRPAYYRRDPGALSFSTEISDLLAMSSTVTINADRVTEFLSPLHVIDEGWWDPTAAFFRGIAIIPNASLWLMTPSSPLRTITYWLPPSVDRTARKETCLHQFKETFLQVLEDYVEGSSIVGVDFSGGLDSTSVAFGLRHVLTWAGVEAQLRTYTLSFDHPDSHRDAARVGTWLGLYKDIYGTILEGDAYCGPLEAGEFAAYSPLANPSLMALPEGFVSLQRRAKDDGCDILLTGEGADYYLAGSDLIWDSLVKSRNFSLLGRSLRELRGRGSANLVAAYLWRFAVLPLLPRPLSARSYLREYYRDTLDFRVPGVFTKEFGSRLRSLVAEQRAALLSYRGRADCWGARLDEELLLPPYILTSGIPTDLEVVSPYLDVRLLDVGLRTPPEFKFELTPTRTTYYASSKILQREGLRGIVPDDVLDNQKKALYGPSMRKRLEDHFARVFDDPDESMLVNNAILDAGALGRIVSNLGNGEYRVAYPEIMWLDAILALELWLRTARTKAGATQIK